MSDIGKSERETQNRVIALFHDELKYRYLGDWIDRESQQLTQRVKELAERYETPMPQVVNRVTELEDKVNGHLERMGFSWE